MNRHRVFFVLISLAAVLLLAGCWGSDKSTSLSVGSGGSVISTATAVGIDKCHNCHANTAVGGVRIFGAWELSRHGNLDNTFDAWDNALGTTNYHAFRTSSTSTSCVPCHNPNLDNNNLPFYASLTSITGLSLESGYTANTARNVVGCEACHGGGSLHFGVGPIGGPTLAAYAVAASDGQSSQYNTCTGCHNDSHHSTSSYRIIGDTHTDNLSRAIGSDIQGYVIRKSSDSACTDCHNPHSANMAATGSPNRQWHASKHGGFTGEGWKHYQWTATNRQSCQRCHTTTGLINFLANQTTYNPANNVFSWMTTSTATDNRSEMLYCYGCHTNYYGGLRTPGQIVSTYTGVSPQTTFPNVAGSNICMACHTGRENGESIKASTGNFANLSFINSHYLTAGATLFATSGYEYDNVTYPGVSDHAHTTIGLTAGTTLTTNGPCVGCHMTSAPNSWDTTQGKHRFLPVGKGNGSSTTDNVTTAMCAVCHTGTSMNYAALQTAEEDALAGLAILDNVLRARGYFFASSYPYFFQTADNTSSSNGVKNWSKRYDGSAGDNTIGKRNMGAAFNYNLFAHDPGFFAHNNLYAKRLIYDSIDWLDDNTLNNSVQTYITTTFPVGQTRTDALIYFGASGRP